MTAFGFQPRMHGSKFFPRTRPVVKWAPLPAESVEKGGFLAAVSNPPTPMMPRLEEVRRSLRGTRKGEEDIAGYEPAKTLAEIAREVALKHGISLLELRSHRRNKALAHVRQEAYARMKRETDASFPKIGRFFGGRDHTTIMAGCKRYEERMAKGEG